MMTTDIDPPTFDTYPVPSFIPAEEVEEHIYGRNASSDAEVIVQLRDLGVAVIRGEYWGGHDRSNYQLEGMYDEDGSQLNGNDDDLDDFVSSLGRRKYPEVIAVDQSMAGGFNGAGDGRTYGGIVEIRLDTLETRKIKEFWEEMNIEENEEANFDDSAVLP